MPVILDLNRDNVVGLRYRLGDVIGKRDGIEREKTYLETAMDKCLVKVENQAFATGMLWGDGGQEGFWDTILQRSCSGEEGRQGSRLTGPIGIPAPPLNISLSSSSSGSSMSSSV